MVETRTLTIPLSVVVGVPNMRFAAYAPPLELREILAKQSEYEEGELVKVKYRIRNMGNGTGIATVEIKDVDTGAVLKTYDTPSLGPLHDWISPEIGLDVGPMPNKDWSLSFKVTP